MTSDRRPGRDLAAATVDDSGPPTASRGDDVLAPFLAEQPAHLLPVFEALADLIVEVVPEARPIGRFGMVLYQVDGNTVCALVGYPRYATVILTGGRDAFFDPEGRLRGTGFVGRHLNVAALADIPSSSLRRWLRTALQCARGWRPPRRRRRASR